MHLETIADTGMKKLVVNRTGTLVIATLASYGAVTLAQDTVRATKKRFSIRKAAEKADRTPQDPTA